MIPYLLLQYFILNNKVFEYFQHSNYVVNTANQLYLIEILEVGSTEHPLTSDV